MAFTNSDGDISFVSTCKLTLVSSIAERKRQIKTNSSEKNRRCDICLTMWSVYSCCSAGRSEALRQRRKSAELAASPLQRRSPHHLS